MTTRKATEPIMLENTSDEDIDSLSAHRRKKRIDTKRKSASGHTDAPDSPQRPAKVARLPEDYDSSPPRRRDARVSSRSGGKRTTTRKRRPVSNDSWIPDPTSVRSLEVFKQVALSTTAKEKDVIPSKAMQDDALRSADPDETLTPNSDHLRLDSKAIVIDCQQKHFAMQGDRRKLVREMNHTLNKLYGYTDELDRQIKEYEDDAALLDRQVAVKRKHARQNDRLASEREKVFLDRSELDTQADKLESDADRDQALAVKKRKNARALQRMADSLKECTGLGADLKLERKDWGAVHENMFTALLDHWSA